MTIAGKPVLRRRLLAARRAVPARVHADEARALLRHLEELAVPATTVCAYAPVGTEPGSIAMLDALLDRGVRVLLPIARTTADGTANKVAQPLMWGEYRPGGLTTAGFGLLEPVPPWMPASELAEATLLLVPALAVDRRGVRLGRGAGFYDRSLVLRRANAQLVAVVRDTELADELPREPHDVPVTHALTPGRGLVALGPG